MATHTAMTTRINPQKIQSAVLNPNIFFSSLGKVEFFVLGRKSRECAEAYRQVRRTILPAKLDREGAPQGAAEG